MPSHLNQCQSCERSVWLRYDERRSESLVLLGNLGFDVKVFENPLVPYMLAARELTMCSQRSNLRAE